MFFLMTIRLPKLFPSLKTILWHYSEAGHGKGAPDGRGGTLKRTADRVVAEGNDICNFDDLFTTLSQKIENIKLIEIQHEQVEQEDRWLDEENTKLKTLKGTM